MPGVLPRQIAPAPHFRVWLCELRSWMFLETLIETRLHLRRRVSCERPLCAG
jgi:hypothetical protein